MILSQETTKHCLKSVLGLSNNAIHSTTNIIMSLKILCTVFFNYMQGTSQVGKKPRFFFSLGITCVWLLINWWNFEKCEWVFTEFNSNWFTFSLTAKQHQKKNWSAPGNRKEKGHAWHLLLSFPTPKEISPVTTECWVSIWQWMYSIVIGYGVFNGWKWMNGRVRLFFHCLVLPHKYLLMSQAVINTTYRAVLSRSLHKPSCMPHWLHIENCLPCDHLSLDR